MGLTRHSGGGVIFLSFVAALVLTILPLPDWVEAFRPEWMAMVLIYWIIALPERVGVGTAWTTGLFMDVARGSVLGQYALAFTVMAFIVQSLHQRMRVYPMHQQSVVVTLLCLLVLLVVHWVKGFIGESPESLMHWMPALSSMLLWPWLFLIMRDLRRKFRVS